MTEYWTTSQEAVGYRVYQVHCEPPWASWPTYCVLDLTQLPIVSGVGNVNSADIGWGGGDGLVQFAGVVAYLQVAL